MKKIFITGGGGYVGSFLVPYLLKRGYFITVYDKFYFGNKLEKNKKSLKIIKGDLRDEKKLEKSIKNHDTLIHLACISNDTSFVLNPKISKEINLDAFEPLVKISKSAGIKKFIYCSTGSVYGVSKQKNVRENHPLVPITLYNKYKAQCEPILLNYTDKNFIGTIIRPATVCGYAPRLRLDLTVNILTYSGYFNSEITIFNGKQQRPNIYIEDMCRIYLKLLKCDSKIIENEIFNCDCENYKVEEIAKIVKGYLEKSTKKETKLKYLPSDDIRSYHLNADKIKNKLGYKNKFTILDGVKSLVKVFKENEKYYRRASSKSIFYNVKHMKINGY